MMVDLFMTQYNIFEVEILKGAMGGVVTFHSG
jgi:hypothetical protein